MIYDRDVLLAWKSDRNVGADLEDFDDVYAMATRENGLEHRGMWVL